jgi:cell division protein FtsW
MTALQTKIQSLLDAVAGSADRPVDKYVLWTVVGLSLVGVVAVYSAITFFAETRLGTSTEGYLIRHVVRAGVAFGAMWLFSLIDYRLLARFSKPLLIGSLGLLGVAYIVGIGWGGATRWLEIGGISFQPSDLARLALLLHLAALLTRKQTYIKSFKRAFVPLFFWIFITAVLIGGEDLSSAALLVMTALVMCFVGRVSVVQLGLIGSVGLLLAGAFLWSSPERAARVESYVGADLFGHTNGQAVFDVQNENYQSRQAEIAFARGGLLGVGPGKSVQRDFLPAAYNDFIFAIIAEEYGIFGALVLLGLFGIWLFRGFLRIARHAPDPFGLFLAVGITAMIALYGFVNAGVACGLLPVTGLPMPLVSYGGTSMLVTGVMIGILLNISRHVEVMR